MIVSSKKAMMGVGVLLIFISTILTSALAAGVLIRTSGTLQQKTVEVEKTTRERLTTGLEFYRINAYANLSNGLVRDYEVVARLKAGSSPIDLSETKLVVTVEDIDLTLSYNASLLGNCTYGQLQPQRDFCVEDLFGNGNSVIEEEELAMLRFRFNSTNAFPSNTYLFMQIFPKIGEVEEIQVRIPSIKSKKIQLY